MMLAAAPTVLLLLLLGAADATASPKPNLMMILTDDQDVTLGGLDPMPQLKKLLADEGVTFHNAFVHTPICCPSRSSYMTGRYLHNSLTFENSIKFGCSNQTWADGPERRSFAAHAKMAGYHSSYAGKYLNQYALPGSPGCDSHNAPGCFKHVPLGWDDWHGLQGNSRYYNCTLSDNGVQKDYGDDPVEGYCPDIFFAHTKAFLSSHIADPAMAATPFLAVLATPSCHGPFTPAPKYAGKFDGGKAPRTPNYNTSNADKQWIMRKLSPLDAALATNIDGIHNHRWETLLSVDDYIGEIVSMLTAAKQMDNTYFLYTSDHGFQLGQHRLPSDKRHPYEHDIRIPFVLRGPGVPKGVTLNHIVLSIDVAPTFVDLMSGAIPNDMDGTSIKPLLAAFNAGDDAESKALKAKVEAGWRTDFMVDYHGQGTQPCGLVQCPAPAANHWHLIDGYNNTFQCVRTLDPAHKIDSTYCQFKDDEHFVEYYDHVTDPWQLKNLAYEKPDLPALKALGTRLNELRGCVGAACRPL